VFVSGVEASVRAGAAEIEKMTEEIKVGRIYTGRVVRIESGAFVEIAQDRMVWYIYLSLPITVYRVEDVVKLDDEITVMVTDIDPAGKSVSHRQAVLKAGPRMRPQANRGSGGGSRVVIAAARRGNRGGFDRGRGGDRGRR
jgi:polyribonucleotide nucleotidyltransferase